MDGNEIRAKVGEEKEQKKRTIKGAISDGWNVAKRKAGECWHWTMTHKGEILTAFVIAKGAISLGKDAGIIKPHVVKNEEDKRLRVYDPRNGYYYYLRRPLTNHEKFELERRSANGEGYGYILSDMGVLSGR